MLTAEIKGDVLHIQIPVNKIPQASASGKSLVVATTNGNVSTPVIVQGKPLTIGLNAYIKNR